MTDHLQSADHETDDPASSRRFIYDQGLAGRHDYENAASGRLGYEQGLAEQLSYWSSLRLARELDEPFADGTETGLEREQARQLNDGADLLVERQPTSSLGDEPELPFGPEPTKLITHEPARPFGPEPTKIITHEPELPFGPEPTRPLGDEPSYGTEPPNDLARSYYGDGPPGYGLDGYLPGAGWRSALADPSSAEPLAGEPLESLPLCEDPVPDAIADQASASYDYETSAVPPAVSESGESSLELRRPRNLSRVLPVRLAARSSQRSAEPAEDDQPPAQGIRRRGSPRNGRWIAAAAAAVVLTIAAGTAVLTLHHGGTGGGNPNGTAPPSRTPSSVISQPKAPPPVGNSLVAVAPAAVNAPRVAVVVTFLTHYFAAINTHDYAAYQQLFSPTVRGELSPAQFTSGYGTTTDSHIVLHSIGAVGSGQVAALVTFTSHQQPADSPTNSSCTNWNIALYLISHGSGYLMESPPSNYAASANACS